MKKIYAATHNICHMGYNPQDGTQLFPDGKYRFGYETDMVETMMQNWEKVYSSFSADIIGIQEHYFWIDQRHMHITEKEIFNRFGYEVEDGDMGLAVASKLPLTRVCELSFAPVSKRRWQKFYIEADGKKIAVFNSHPTPKDNREIRRQEYELLLDEFKNEECFIAFGDYNARSIDEFEIFADAGYHMANAGITTTVGGHTCDNIIVSSNIEVGDILLFDEGFSLSDHNILLAELLIKE